MKFSAYQWVCIHIANCYGLDKKSWQVRLDWVKANFDSLESFTEEADEPNQYAVAVEELRSIHQGQATGLPVGLDATASFLQLASVLVGCETTARNCNVICTGERLDPYQLQTDEMNKALNGALDIKRKDAKGALMKGSYGSTLAVGTTFNDDEELIELFWNTVEKLFPSVTWLRDTLFDAWNPEATHHIWTLPDGHTACVPVTAVEEYEFDLEFECESPKNPDWMNNLSEDGAIHLTQEIQVLSTEKESVSLLANVIQSFDAYVVRQMHIQCRSESIPLITNHDAFLTLPSKVERMRDIYREILSELAKSNALENVLEELGAEVHNKDTQAANNIATQVLVAEYSLS